MTSLTQISGEDVERLETDVSIFEHQKPKAARRWRLGRRRFLQLLGGSALAAGGLAGWTFGIEPIWLEVAYHQLQIRNLPPFWIGKRVVQASDLHVGVVAMDYLKRTIQQINELQPDLLVMTGDFINHSDGSLLPLPKIVAELRPAKVATVGCLGNHDYGNGWYETATASAVADILRDHGINLLRDEKIEVEGLDIFGLEELWAPNFEAITVLRQAESERPALCLCHNPDICDRKVWGDFQGFIFAGHTHGGQCKPPFLPPPIVPVRNKRYTSGFFEVATGVTLHISRGIGYTQRLRFNCRPEISVFELAAA
jgi:hypothetical protein